MTTEQGGHDLVEVRLLGLPLRLFARSRDHGAELRREFELLQLGSHRDHDVPRRLLALAEEMTDEFGSFTAAAEAEIAAAQDRGDVAIDLVYRVPPTVGEAARHLADLFDEADAYCRSGEELLTLAAPSEVVAFRRWFLGEFASQAQGRPPTPWAAFAAS